MPKRRPPVQDDLYDDEIGDPFDDVAEESPAEEDDSSPAAPDSQSPLESMILLLEGLSVDQLRAIAARRGWTLTGTRREQFVQQLAGQLAQEPRPASFSPDEDQFIRVINTHVGLAITPVAAPLRMFWKQRVGGDMGRFDRAVEGLQQQGVIFPCTREKGTPPHYHWSPFLHSEDLPLLTPQIKLYPVEKVARLTVPRPLPAPTAVADALMELAAREPLRLRPRLHAARLDDLPVTRGWEYDPREVQQATRWRSFDSSTTGLTVPLDPAWDIETAALLEILAGGSREMGLWVATTLLRQGILRRAEGELVTLDVDQAGKWRNLSPDVQHAWFWQAWRDGIDHLLELQIASRRAGIRIQRSGFERAFTPDLFAGEIGEARRFAIRLLTPLAPHTWYSWKAFAERVRDLRADFIHTLTSAQTWYLVHSKTRHSYQATRTSDWDAAYRPILAAMLETVPHWLGAVELRYDGSEPAAFRVTVMGAWLFSNGAIGAFTGPAQDAGSAGPRSVHWLDDHTLRLSALAEATRLLPLIRSFADPAREVLTFHVTPVSFARALERGITVAEIAGKFAGAGAPLPPSLRERLEALAANYGRTHLYEHLTVLELSDDYALRELLAATNLGEHIVHQFSPRVVVVRDDAVETLVAEMVKKGYTPRVTERGDDGGA